MIRSLLILIFLICGNAFSKTVEEIVPITSKNLKGHQALYNQGWMVVTSTQKALDYAYDHSVISSANAWQAMNKNLEINKQEFQNDKDLQSKTSAEKSQKIRESVSRQATLLKESVANTSSNLEQSAIELRKKAFDTFVIGYIELQHRTADDAAELRKVNQNIFSGLKDDFSNYQNIFGQLNEKASDGTHGIWASSFVSATVEFQKEYLESHDQKNSLLGLWNLGLGYIKASYYGVLKPTAATTFAVVGTGYQVIERTVFAVTGNFYYASKIGYKIISPTLESGLLASLSLISWSARKLNQGFGVGINAISQVAVVSSEPLYRSGRWLVATADNTAKYAAVSVYEVGKRTGEILINQIQAGLVLGYNALTAIPTQALMGAANSVIFLGYEGPKLALYAAKGDVSGVSVSKIPVGSVVDINKLKSQNGVEIKVISEDSAVIKEVIEKSSQDQKK